MQREDTILEPSVQRMLCAVAAILVQQIRNGREMDASIETLQEFQYFSETMYDINNPEIEDKQGGIRAPQEPTILGVYSVLTVFQQTTQLR